MRRGKACSMGNQGLRGAGPGRAVMSLFWAWLVGKTEVRSGIQWEGSNLKGMSVNLKFPQS